MLILKRGHHYPSFGSCTSQNNMAYHKLLGSSVDPNKLSMTVKGILTAIVPIILMFAPMFQWQITPEDFNDFSQGLESLIVAVTAAISAWLIVWGALRKILVATGVMKVK